MRCRSQKIFKTHWRLGHDVHVSSALSWVSVLALVHLVSSVDDISCQFGSLDAAEKIEDDLHNAVLYSNISTPGEFCEDSRLCSFRRLDVVLSADLQHLKLDQEFIKDILYARYTCGRVNGECCYGECSGYIATGPTCKLSSVSSLYGPRVLLFVVVLVTAIKLSTDSDQEEKKSLVLPTVNPKKSKKDSTTSWRTLFGNAVTKKQQKPKRRLVRVKKPKKSKKADFM